MNQRLPIAAYLVAAATALAATVARAAEIEQVPVYVGGQDGYHTYRIPSLLVTSKGTLLAFSEGRKKNRNDSGDIDLVLKRSVDGGKTWGPMQLVWDDGKNTCGNPCPVVDASTGTIWLLLTHNLGADNEKLLVAGRGKGTRTVWLAKSDDDGASWSNPVEITRQAKRPEWTWYATGPGVGIQLRSGRLLVPCDNKLTEAKLAEGPTLQSHVIYSDDHGKSWQIGGVVGPGCNESQAVELGDGTLMLNIRSFRDDRRRLVALSKDGGQTFSEPKPDAALIDPNCQGSIVRAGGAGDELLFSNPASTKREKLSVRASRDGGQTWPDATLLHAGPAAYSCLAVLADGTILCLYERGEKHAYETITAARFRRE